ncbi:IRF3 factor, partial [Rhinopomastus cyanomelas]|nr:IRF3 factor [Rhinopomastus cyanomelas]
REAQRLRFGPWLLRAVSSGIYQGLRWTGPERDAFRVPWKHIARRDVTSSDVEIFKVRGCVEVRSPPCTPGLGKGQWWKTNFRCALRSTQMFELLEDNSKCSDDPHKVF